MSTENNPTFDPFDLLIRQYDVWDTAYDNKSSHDGYPNSNQPAIDYAQSKLDEFNKIFAPIPTKTVSFETDVDADELYKCAYDVRYFIENYCIIYDDLITLKPKQFEMLNMAELGTGNGEKSNYARQEGTTTIFSMFLLHKAIFQSHYRIGIVGNTRAQSRHIIDLMKSVYEKLPPIFKSGGTPVFNKNEIMFENGSNIATFTKNPDNFRGHSLNYLFIDNLQSFTALEDLKRETFPFINARIINVESS